MIVSLNLMTTFLCIVGIAVDITAFFLLVRMLVTWKHFELLVYFDNVGRPLVEAVISKTDYLFGKVSDKRLSGKGVLFVSMIILIVVKIMVAGILRQCHYS